MVVLIQGTKRPIDIIIQIGAVAYNHLRVMIIYFVLYSPVMELWSSNGFSTQLFILKIKHINE